MNTVPGPQVFNHWASTRFTRKVEREVDCAPFRDAIPSLQKQKRLMLDGIRSGLHARPPQYLNLNEWIGFGTLFPSEKKRDLTVLRKYY
jgi:hypothetical protein